MLKCKCLDIRRQVWGAQVNRSSDELQLHTQLTLSESLTRTLAIANSALEHMPGKSLIWLSMSRVGNASLLLVVATALSRSSTRMEQLWT